MTLLLISLAAICNAIMDKVSFHFHASIFKGYNDGFWNPELSWKNKYIIIESEGGKTYINKKALGIFPYPTFLTDGWHFFKSLMIVLLALSVITYKPIIYWYIDFIIIGIVWNVTFNLFFNHALKSKRE